MLMFVPSRRNACPRCACIRKWISPTGRAHANARRQPRQPRKRVSCRGAVHTEMHIAMRAPALDPPNITGTHFAVRAPAFKNGYLNARAQTAQATCPARRASAFKNGYLNARSTWSFRCAAMELVDFSASVVATTVASTVQCAFSLALCVSRWLHIGARCAANNLSLRRMRPRRVHRCTAAVLLLALSVAAAAAAAVGAGAVEMPTARARRRVACACVSQRQSSGVA